MCSFVSTDLKLLACSQFEIVMYPEKYLWAGIVVMSWRTKFLLRKIMCMDLWLLLFNFLTKNCLSAQMWLSPFYVGICMSIKRLRINKIPPNYFLYSVSQWQRSWDSHQSLRNGHINSWYRNQLLQHSFSIWLLISSYFTFPVCLRSSNKDWETVNNP